MDALAVPEEDMLRLQAAEGATGRDKAQERVDTQRLSTCSKVGEAAERVGAHEDPLRRKPEGDLPPEPAPDEGQHDKRRARDLRERCHVERDAKPLGDRGAVPLVPVDELDHACRVTERAYSLVDAPAVDHVGQPDAAPDFERCEVRCSRSPSVLQPNPCSNSSLNGTPWEHYCRGLTRDGPPRYARVADRLETFATFLDLAPARAHTRRARTGGQPS